VGTAASAPLLLLLVPLTSLLLLAGSVLLLPVLLLLLLSSSCARYRSIRYLPAGSAVTVKYNKHYCQYPVQITLCC
jgi:hypothetical protein